MPEFDVAVAFQVLTDKVVEGNNGINKLAPVKPIRKVLGGSVQVGATAPAQVLLECQTQPSAGRVWNVLFVGVMGSDPHTSNTAKADIYAGVPADALLTQQNFTDVIASGQAIPSFPQFSDDAIWIHSNERLYAIIVTPTINQQYVLVARVAEYAVCDIEATTT